MQLVTPSVVAMAVRTEIAICKIVFQVFTFIIFILMLTFLMLNVDLVGDALASSQGGPQARALFKPIAAILRAASAAFLGSTTGST